MHDAKPAISLPTDDLTTRRAQLADRERALEASRTSLWEPLAPPAPRAPSPTLSADHERTLVAIVLRPLSPGETHAAGYATRERELCAALLALPPIELLAFRNRITASRPDDVLAAAFARMTIDRRQRIVAFAARAPRLRTRR